MTASTHEAEVRPPGSDGPWLEVRGIAKHYGGVKALRSASMDLLAGEVHGIIGPNGAGKSTLVKLLGGVESADTGSILVDGSEVEMSSPSVAQQHRIILMPQELSLVPESSIVDNIVLGSEPTVFGALSAKQARRRSASALDAIGLDLPLSAQVSDLSTVHKRLLMLARALDRAPRLLILDEPTAGLAAHEASLVMDTVSRVVAKGVTVIYISHHLTEVAKLCNRVSTVREGRMVDTICGDDITKAALVERIVGSDNATHPSGSVAFDPATVTSPPDRSSGLQVEGLAGARIAGISFLAPRGSVTGITGLLGSGVAELVSTIAGASRPLRGTIRLDGIEENFSSPADALRRGVGYLAGDRTTAVVPEMSVRENVSISALSRWTNALGIVKKRRELSATKSILHSLAVDVDVELPITALSGGNQQRALVGRLVASEVEFIILDEPTVGVDLAARQALWDVIHELSQTRTVIVASSEPDELVALCDQVVCLKHGSVAQVLTAQEINQNAITHAVT